MHQFEVRTDGLTTIGIVNRDTDREVLNVSFHTQALMAVCAAVLRLNLDPRIETTEDARAAVRELRHMIPGAEDESDPSWGALTLRILAAS